MNQYEYGINTCQPSKQDKQQQKYEQTVQTHQPSLRASGPTAAYKILDAAEFFDFKRLYVSEPAPYLLAPNTDNSQFKESL